MKATRIISIVSVIAGLGATATLSGQQDGFRFRSAVELVNVTATVTDRNGRFVSGLRKDDFRVFEDGVPQQITHFSAERVPVSLGIVLDTSSSMSGEKMRAARRALERFLFELLDPADEIFLYRFDEDPELVQGWTTDRQQIMRALGRLEPQGGTAMYDAVAEAVRIAERGRHRKKALLLISDGNDTSSATALTAIKQLIRQTEVLVYAIGIDARAESSAGIRWQRGAATRILSQRRPPRPPIPLPFPIPGGRRPPPTWPPRTPPKPQPNPPSTGFVRDSPANEEALREITDDSGGRTEMIRSANDLDPATAGIADELSRQYYLGYSPTAKKDGLWHTIEVRVGDQSHHVRARRGYVATP